MKKCCEIMTKNPVCCLSTDLVSSVAELMKNEHVGSIPVIENSQTRKLIGILTDYDLALMMGAESYDATSTKVETVMTHKVVVCRAEDTVQKAFDVMSENQLRRIIVVDDDSKILGVIVRTDIAPLVDRSKKIVTTVKEISQVNAN